LHRISRKLNQHDHVIALTIRFGYQMGKPLSSAEGNICNSVVSTIDMIMDIVRSRKSILIIGKPGVGKTTLLREFARVLSTIENAQVEIIDSSNEIAGCADTLHPAIGEARRMVVRDRSRQHEVMIEAVQNHSPECIIIDEIGNRQEARAARDIAQRGVQIIGTAHGSSLQQIMSNRELNGLVGGTHAVTLSGEDMRRRGLRTKTVSERVGACAFDCAIELQSTYSWVIHHDLSRAVDDLLDKRPLVCEVRRFDPCSRQVTVEKVRYQADKFQNSGRLALTM
jgi:stage III sporulation protein SpoIIIAA